MNLGRIFMRVGIRSIHDLQIDHSRVDTIIENIDHQRELSS